MEKGGEYMGAGVRWKKRFFCEGGAAAAGERGKGIREGGEEDTSPFPALSHLRIVRKKG